MALLLVTQSWGRLLVHQVGLYLNDLATIILQSGRKFIILGHFVTFKSAAFFRGIRKGIKKLIYLGIVRKYFYPVKMSVFLQHKYIIS